MARPDFLPVTVMLISRYRERRSLKSSFRAGICTLCLQQISLRFPVRRVRRPSAEDSSLAACADKVPADSPRPFRAGGRPTKVLLNLRGLDAGNLFQVALTNFLFADFEFLHFAAHGHRKALHKADIFRDFEIRDLSLAEVANLFFAAGFPG